MTAVREWKCVTIGAANRITVITSDPTHPVRKIHKRVPAAADLWTFQSCKDDQSRFLKRPIFNQTLQWNEWKANGTPIALEPPMPQDPPLHRREMEISPLQLPNGWLDNEGKPIRISFGTCLDAQNDLVHGSCNLCIYVGAGFPLDNVVDTVPSVPDERHADVVSWWTCVEKEAWVLYPSRRYGEYCRRWCHEEARESRLKVGN